jgi:hypothetical protein
VILKLSKAQREVVQTKLDKTVFLEGAAGTGKTTAGVGRLEHLLDAGVFAGEIMVLVPQRTLALRYMDVDDSGERAAGGQVNVVTVGGLARRAVDIFWPLVAEEHGFREANLRPVFLSLETAQYYMARVVGSLIDEKGYFDTVSVERNRIYSQIIDNLNKAAVMGFPHVQIGERLKSAWSGNDTAQLHMYDEVQECASLFRVYCLQHNLLDFSLQMEVFKQRLWGLPQCQQFILGQGRHIIADNVEEDTPVAHEVLGDLLQKADSALVIYDTEAGYRRFLGADADNAYLLRQTCDTQITLTESFVATADMEAFGTELGRGLERNVEKKSPDDVDPRNAIRYQTDYRYHPEMIDGVAEEIVSLVEGNGVDPGQIVVLAPYLSDALRFSLMNRLEAAGIAVRSHRPSRSLREEPATSCLLTLAQLAHPAWGIRPARFDVVYALMEAINGLDLGRAQLLVHGAYKIVDTLPHFEAFDAVKADYQERITFELGNRYDKLRLWINNYIVADQELALDHFFSRLFGEVLSQAGFGFHDSFDAAEVTANLIDSTQKFRRIIMETGTPLANKSPAQEYVEMVSEGIIADSYLYNWSVEDKNAVLLAPAYTFLLSNNPVDYQFWLNIGGRGWSERLYQPLTNPYVLTRFWTVGRKWTDGDEMFFAQEGLYRLVLGLARRCRQLIYLGYSELGEQGYEQRGELLYALQQMLRR